MTATLYHRKNRIVPRLLATITCLLTLQRHSHGDSWGDRPVSQSLAQSKVSPNQKLGPFHPNAISSFIRLRCGFNEKFSERAEDGESDGLISRDIAIWTYEGTLTDPMTGKVIAEVEGLELIKPLPMILSPYSFSEKVLTNHSATSSLIMDESLIGNLSVKKLLFPSNRSRNDQSTSTPPWDAATTILCRRLFCYRQPSLGNDRIPNANVSDPSKQLTKNSKIIPNNSLLTSIRLRPDGPLRRVSPLASMSVYDSAVTYISRNCGRELVVYSERGGSCNPMEHDRSKDDSDIKNCKENLSANDDQIFVMGSARGSGFGNNQNDPSFDFTIHARKGLLSNIAGANGRIGDGPKLPPLIEHDAADIVVSPPRARFLQFGRVSRSSGNSNPLDRKYGSVHETYSYSFAGVDGDNNASVQSTSEGLEYDGNSFSSEGGLVGRFQRLLRMKPSKSSKSLDEATIQTLPRCAVRYTRYGEAPPWYAPGIMCNLELRGRRIDPPDSFERVFNKSLPAVANYFSPLVIWAASRCNPSFWSGWPAKSAALVTCNGESPQNSANIIAQSINSFFEERRRVIEPKTEELRETKGSRYVKFMDDSFFSTAHSCVDKLSKSFMTSEIPTQV